MVYELMTSSTSYTITLSKIDIFDDFSTKMLVVPSSFRQGIICGSKKIPKSRFFWRPGGPADGPPGGNFSPSKSPQ